MKWFIDIMHHTFQEEREELGEPEGREIYYSKAIILELTTCIISGLLIILSSYLTFKIVKTVQKKAPILIL